MCYICYTVLIFENLQIFYLNCKFFGQLVDYLIKAKLVFFQHQIFCCVIAVQVTI